MHEAAGAAAGGVRRAAARRPGTACAAARSGAAATPRTVAVCDGDDLQRRRGARLRARRRAARCAATTTPSCSRISTSWRARPASGAPTRSSRVAMWDAPQAESGARRAIRSACARSTTGRRPAGSLFASEIKALLAVPDVPVEPDDIAVSHYLTFLTVPGPRTLFKGISKLAAGSTATFDASGDAEVEAVLGPAVGAGGRGRRRELLRRPRAQAARRGGRAAHGGGPDRRAGQRRQRLERQRVDHRAQDQGGGRQPAQARCTRSRSASSSSRARPSTTTSCTPSRSRI